MAWNLQQDLLLSHTGDNPNVNKILRAHLRRKKQAGEQLENGTCHAWGEDFFVLNQSKLYQKLSVEMRNNILTRSNDFILSNSYFIEKAGLAYCAKMIMLAQSTEVRQIYGLIASDESVHLAWLTPYVKENLRSTPQGQFIRFMSSLIEQCHANTLYYLIQTILEGWGIFYYKTLSRFCQIPVLQQTFMNIIKDEALHHQTGVALFNPNQINLQDKKQIDQSIQGYLEILRAGPQDIIYCIESELGELTQQEVTQLFEDLQSESSSMAKVSIFKNLCAHPFISSKLADLECQGAFTPYTPKKCAKIFKENIRGFSSDKCLLTRPHQ